MTGQMMLLILVVFRWIYHFYDHIMHITPLYAWYNEYEVKRSLSKSPIKNIFGYSKKRVMESEVNGLFLEPVLCPPWLNGKKTKKNP